MRQIPFSAITLNIAAGQKDWSNREPFLQELFEMYHPDIFAGQEVTKQAFSKLNSLAPAFYSFETGEIIGDNNLNIIGWNSSRFIKLENGFFYLSHDGTNTASWDAKNSRGCTWALFQDRLSEEKLLTYNIHLDHIGLTAQVEATKQILASINQHSGVIPVIMLGDFNSGPFIRENGDDRSEPHGLIARSGFVDAYRVINGGWPPKATMVREPWYIDIIYVRALNVLRAAKLEDKYSDHFPIFAELSSAI